MIKGKEKENRKIEWEIFHHVYVSIKLFHILSVSAGQKLYNQKHQPCLLHANFPTFYLCITWYSFASPLSFSTTLLKFILLSMVVMTDYYFCSSLIYCVLGLFKQDTAKTQEYKKILRCSRQRYCIWFLTTHRRIPLF